MSERFDLCLDVVPLEKDQEQFNKILKRVEDRKPKRGIFMLTPKTTGLA
jgi:hypothetical protein